MAKPLTEKEKNLIIGFKGQGLSLTAIGAKLKRSHNTIKRYLDDIQNSPKVTKIDDIKKKNADFIFDAFEEQSERAKAIIQETFKLNAKVGALDETTPFDLVKIAGTVLDQYLKIERLKLERQKLTIQKQEAEMKKILNEDETTNDNFENAMLKAIEQSEASCDDLLEVDSLERIDDDV